MFTTRPARPEDAGLITRHRHAMFEDMGRSADVLKAMSCHFQPWVAERLTNGSYLGWITEHNGQPVASAGILLIVDFPPSPQDPTGSPRGHLLNVYVAAEYRRKGLARKLVEYCMAEARRRSLRVLSLHASDKGRPLYETVGFRATNEMQLVFAEAG